MTSYIRKHTIFPEEFPEPWASDWGEDEFGLWMAFTYKGVRQAFRWCEPGAFMMGSPPDERSNRPSVAMRLKETRCGET